MTRYRTTALAAVAAGFALVASAALAHSGDMGGDMQGHGGMGGMGGMHGDRHGHHGGGGRGAGPQLMTPQEREALHEKMRSAKTPEERQALAAATRAEMEKRARDKGIALPERHGRGPEGGHRH